MGDVTIHQVTDFKSLKKPTVVLGFPGTGLVGSVAASQISDSLQMRFGGYFTSSDFAPLAAIHNYRPMPAARIHFSEKYNLIVIISEMSIPVASSMELANKIFEFSKAVGAEQVISLGGISLKETKDETYIVSSDARLVKEIVNRKIAKPIKEGATTGVTGILLTLGTLRNFPITAILVEASEEYLDPKAAATALRALNKITGLDINPAQLEKEGKDLTKGLKEAMIKARISKKKGPTTEEGGNMFG